MKHLSKFLMISLAVLMASCSDDDPKNPGEDPENPDTPQYSYTETPGYAQCYVLVDGNRQVAGPVNFGIDFDAKKAMVEFNNVASLSEANSFTLNGFSWKVDDDNVGESTSAPLHATYSTGKEATVKDFEFEWNQWLSSTSLEGESTCYFEFSLDGKKLEGVSMPFTFYGTTTSTSEGVDPFTSGVNAIIATPDFEKMEMSVLINGAQFAAAMPGLPIAIEGIPMEISKDNKTFTFSASMLIPSIMGVPYPTYECSNISGRLNPFEGMTFQFDCNVMGRKIYNVQTSPTLFGN